MRSIYFRVFIVLIVCGFTSAWTTNRLRARIGDDHVIRTRLLMLPPDVVTAIQCFDDKNIDIAKYAVEGALAGGLRALSRGITFPLDTIKTWTQADDEATDTTTRASIKTNESKPGFNEYYKGAIPTVLSAVPANSIFFVVYNVLEIFVLCSAGPAQGGVGGGDFSHIHTSRESNLFIERLIISAIATLPQNAIKIPAELIKQRAQTRANASTTALFMEALQSEGIQGLYVGGGAQLLREIPYNALQMSTYELLKESNVFNADALSIAGGSLDPTLIAGLMGLIAAAVAATLTQPFDVLKTRLMTSSVRTSLWESLYDILSTKGVRGLFVGLIPRLTLVSVGGAIYFAAASLAESTWGKL